MAPAQRGLDRAGRSLRVEQSVEPGIGVSLEDPGPGREMRLGMFATPITGEAEEYSRWRRAAERPVVADIAPEPCGLGPALGEQRYRGVVAVQAFGREHMRRDQGVERECQVFCVWVIGSMLPERSKDDDDFQRTAGRAAEGLQAA